MDNKARVGHIRSVKHDDIADQGRVGLRVAHCE